MRIVILCTIVLLSAGCIAQTTSQIVDSQIAAQTPDLYLNGEPLPGPGVYAMPFIPRIATPIVELPEPPLQVGASDATGENVTGAQDRTLNTLPQRVEPPLIAPKLSGAQVSSDIYPRADGGASH
ncbi:MAG: hypothetical protein ACRD2U_09145 [Terriglobales bacterium]